MDVMFIIPAAVASCVVPCRLFVSLAELRRKNAHVQAAAPPRPGRAADAQGRRGTGTTIAGTAYRNMVAGIESMGDTDELDVLRTTGTIAVLDLKPEGITQNGRVAVHTETMVHSDDGENSVDMVDLEKAGSLSHWYGQRSFVPNV